MNNAIETTVAASNETATVKDIAKKARAAERMGRKAEREWADVGADMLAAGFTLENIKKGESMRPMFDDLAARSLVFVAHEDHGEGSLSEKALKVLFSKAKGDTVLCTTKGADGGAVERSKQWVQMQLDKPRKRLIAALKRAIAKRDGKKEAPATSSKTDLQKVAERLQYLMNRTADESPLCKDVAKAQAGITALATMFGVSKLVKTPE
jgi:hypothetical protein